MKRKTQCPDCSRKFSSHLVAFPRFIDDKDETMVYNICPLCVVEARTKRGGLDKDEFFITKYSQKLYEEALIENKRIGRHVSKPIARRYVKWEKLTRLTPEEKEKVFKKHPKLFKN